MQEGQNDRLFNELVDVDMRCLKLEKSGEGLKAKIEDLRAAAGVGK
jgi:hypothetical protein